MNIFKLLFHLGAKIRNPSLFHQYNFLKSSENWSYNSLLNYQFKKCKEFLNFANKYSKFWNDYFINCKFKPEKMSSLEDLKYIPPIDKNTLLNYNEDIHTNFSFNKTFFCETSGTSGQILKFWRNEEWDSFNRASVMRGYSWYNVSMWERHGYIWGYNFDKKSIFKTRFLDFLQHRFRLFSYQNEELFNFSKKLKNAKYLRGYASMLYEIAKTINNNNLSKPELKLVISSAEKLLDTYNQELKNAFGQLPVNEYGAAESGIIGFECPYGYIHINMEQVVVEEIDNQIIVTNLLSKSFPIIRYQLGDYVELGSAFKCDCGLETPIINNIIGRIGKKIYGKNKSYPHSTVNFIFKSLAKNYHLYLNYQVIQFDYGTLVFRLDRNLLNNEQDLLEKAIYDYFQNDIEYSILENETLHTKNGKYQDFISYLE